jgi:hypothetical protein
MRPSGRLALPALLMILGVFGAACSSPSFPARPAAAAEGSSSLDTSMAGPGGTWAVVVMGGSAAQHDNFWQLFARPAGSAGWKLVTPPGVATNGGIAVAYLSRSSLIAGVDPNHNLTFSPLALTGDGGTQWTASNAISPGFAQVPDALAAAPSGQLLALTRSGDAMLARHAGSGWTTLASEKTLAATPPGRSCGLASLTAVAFTPTGTPLLAGTCTHHGTAGIFAAVGSSWRPAGPALPGSLADQQVRVLRLTRTGSTDVAVLLAGTQPSATLLAAWSGDGGGHWTLSPRLQLGTTQVLSTAFGAGGAVGVVQAGGRAQVANGPGAPWRLLPVLPAGTLTLALGSAGTFDALAVHRTKMADWQLTHTSPVAWRQAQVVSVPIQFGSSG